MKKSNTLRFVPGWLPIAGLALLAASSARADYQSTVIADHPIAYFALDLTIDNNGTATDLSGNGNNSTYYNISPVSGPSAYIPNAAFFTGAYLQSYVDLGTAPNPSILNFGGPITMEAWVQSTNTTQGPADILGKGYDSTINDAELVLRANGGYNYYGGTYNNTNNGASASGGQQTTNWTYLVSTYDGTNWNLYVNTKLVGTGADSVGALNFPDPWRIGTGSADGATRYYVGNICQVALYTNALTAAQVMNHFYFGYLNAAPTVSIPIIVAQPQSQPSFVGGTASFSVSAVSALPSTNQWYFGSTPLAGQTNTTLTLSNLQLTNSGNYSVVIGNANGTTNSAPAVLTVAVPRNLQWSATANSGTWDTNSANWINLANSQATVFNPGDGVLFDDTTGVPTTVAVTGGGIVPSVATVNSSVNNYTFNGPNQLSGFGTLVKEGSSTLSIFTPSGFPGSVAIGGGTVYAGNNCFSASSSIVITNNATMDLGGGQFNNFIPITISGTGVGGQGALVNSYGDYPVESVNIAMIGDTVFGGTQRWDLANGSTISGAHNLIIDWSADTSNPYGEWNSPIIGSTVASITLTNGSKIGAKNCDSTFQNPGTMMNVGANGQLIFWNGGWNGSLHVFGGAQVYLWTAPAAFNGSNIIFEDNAVWSGTGGSGDEPINSAITFNGVAHFQVGDNNRIYTNLLSGPGGFVMDVYNHQLILSCSNTYAGPTVIGAGPQVALTGNGSITHSSLIFFGGWNTNSLSTQIDVSGRTDQTLTLASGQTLAGIGTVNGSLVVSPGATISPSGTNTTIGITTGANPFGALAATGNITLGGTTVIKLDGPGTNDAVQTSGTITYGGTLNLVNISGTPLAAGNSFQVFTAAGYSGSFGNIVPTTPGPGLAWDTTQLNAGIISVMTGQSQPGISGVSISGGNFILSGTNGTANGNYVVLTSTNVALPLAGWTPIATNSYDNTGAFHATNKINSALNRSFYTIQSQ